MNDFIFATHNAHKAQELQAMLPEIRVQTLSDLGHIDEIPETAKTLEGNALLKAKATHQLFGGLVVADDTGLEVEALNGAPGVRSARYAGEPRDDTKNLKKLLHELHAIDNRRAQFRTVICLFGQEKPLYFEGIVKGTILETPKGAGGFGYDPVFVPEGYTQTFAELPMKVKNRISHRGLAVQKLVEHFKNDS